MKRFKSLATRIDKVGEGNAWMTLKHYECVYILKSELLLLNNYENSAYERWNLIMSSLEEDCYENVNYKTTHRTCS